jgi:predicted HNH restriction endonuclease
MINTREYLEFHHIEPSSKSFGISSGGFSRSWVSIEAEIKKCILVCANCHREIEYGLVKLNGEDLQSVDKPLE